MHLKRGQRERAQGTDKMKGRPQRDHKELALGFLERLGACLITWSLQIIHSSEVHNKNDCNG